MKKYQVGYDVKGMLIMAHECEDYTPTPEIDGAVFVQVSEDEYLTLKKSVGMPDWRRESNAFVESPTRPSPHHDWDWPTKSWLPNLDAAREAKLQQVSAELNARLYLPCNGFDADKISRERISGMIARLQRGDGLPVGWVGWRDADNQQQWVADDAETVLVNLTALSRVIEDREQTLLIAAWQHKANIAALTDIDAILIYDATQAWPT